MRSLIEDEDLRPKVVEIPPTATSLDLLQAVYRNSALDLHVRMRAAGMAIAYEMPKLAVVAQISESDFAAVLDRRLENLKRLEQNQANGRAAPTPPVEVKPPMPRLADRRYRRF